MEGEHLRHFPILVMLQLVPVVAVMTATVVLPPIRTIKETIVVTIAIVVMEIARLIRTTTIEGETPNNLVPLLVKKIGATTIRTMEECSKGIGRVEPVVGLLDHCLLHLGHR